MGRDRLGPRVSAWRLTLVVLSLVVTSCASNLSFRTDHRLHWEGPPARSLVQLPMTVSWTFTGAHGEFVVFVDRTPIKPGQTLRALASHDPSCLSDPTCPDADYLAERRVYETDATSIQLSQVPILSGDADKVQLHQVTIVLLNAAGHRVGESAWTREFKLRKPTI